MYVDMAGISDIPGMVGLGDYYFVRVLQLKPEAADAELEELISSGFWEMQRWIPGVKHLSLVRLRGETRRYLLIITFTNSEAYMYWQQVEDEARDYWERYAAVLMRLEQLCYLVEEYAGRIVSDAKLSDSVQPKS